MLSRRGTTTSCEEFISQLGERIFGDHDFPFPPLPRDERNITKTYTVLKYFFTEKLKLQKEF